VKFTFKLIFLTVMQENKGGVSGHTMYRIT